MRLAPYPREWLILALIALGTLPLVSVSGAQDSSRLALTDSIVLRGHVDIDPYWQLSTDRAFYGGHWYSDKAPGVALLEVPAVAVARAAGGLHAQATKPIWLRPWPLWGLRIWGGGLAFMALVFLVGRVAEGRVAGAGALSATVFGVGTMAGSLGPTIFGHIPDALALFAAYVLATRARRSRDWVWVGVLAGAGVLFEYPAGLAAAILVVYAAIRGGRSAALATVAGGIPAAVVLGLYNLLAFGAPWRLSYRYTDNVFTPQQQENLFGIGVPTGHGIWTLLIDGHGLLLVSPVLLPAIAGLVALGRRDRLEAWTAGAIAFVFALTTTGYFLPNGGLSPGPRFSTAALPFLLLGLPFALARRRALTLVLAGCSIGVALFDELTWSVANRLQFLKWPETIWSLAGLSQREGSLLLLAAGAAAGIVALAATATRRLEAHPNGLIVSASPDAS
ncbi:MAG TPA: glycosyltransferase family 39 protein [Gaiellaceae bacterium]